MAKKTVLIVEDERDWIAKHKFWLEEAGFDCIYACDGREAIDAAINQTSIKVAIVDEILLEKNNYGNEVTQPLQGVDVRDEIRKQRDDIYFIVVSSKPEKEVEKWQNDPRKAFREASNIENEIRREERVVNFFHKYNLENPQKMEEEYHFLIETIKEILNGKKTPVNQVVEVEFPSIYIGFGVNGELLAEQGKRSTPKSKFIRNLFDQYSQNNNYDDISIDRKVRELQGELKKSDQKTVLEKKVFWIPAGEKFTYSKAKEIKKKGTKKMITAFKADTRPFQILEWLAWQVSLRNEPTISAEQYLYDICGQPRPATGEGKQSTAQFVQEQGEAGFSVIAFNAQKRKQLTVKISQLSTTLVEANIGFSSNKQIFNCDDGTTTYTALFKTGMVFYAVKGKK